MKKSQKDWEMALDAESYRVLREKGTERPFSGKYNDHKEAGIYKCKGCGEELFTSEMKFDSGCGWPSFDREVEGEKIARIHDSSHGMIRTEIVCSSCDGHLGHVFPDGPEPSGLRYCINSESMQLEKGIVNGN